MATPEEVFALLGVEIGSVPPFGNLEGLDLFVDETMAKNEEIVFNPGVHIKSITIKYTDYLSVANPKLGDFIQTEIKE
jgi:Ala-tRNA(Pro) deacylase